MGKVTFCRPKKLSHKIGYVLFTAARMSQFSGTAAFPFEYSGCVECSQWNISHPGKPEY